MVSWALFAPTSLAAAVVIALVVRAGDGAWVTPAQAEDALASALEESDMSRAHGALRAGANPNATVPFRHGDMTGGQTISISPLVIATARGDENMVRMLLAEGARPADSENRFAICVAEALNHDVLRNILEQSFAESHPDCPRRRRNRPILLLLRDEMDKAALQSGESIQQTLGRDR